MLSNYVQVRILNLVSFSSTLVDFVRLQRFDIVKM